MVSFTDQNNVVVERPQHVVNLDQDQTRVKARSDLAEIPAELAGFA